MPHFGRTCHRLASTNSPFTRGTTTAHHTKMNEISEAAQSKIVNCFFLCVLNFSFRSVTTHWLSVAFDGTNWGFLGGGGCRRSTAEILIPFRQNLGGGANCQDWVYRMGGWAVPVKRYLFITGWSSFHCDSGRALPSPGEVG